MNRMVIFIFLTFVFAGCSRFADNEALHVRQHASIHPAYEGTVIPYNLAPLNFMICEEGSRYRVRFSVAGKDSFDVASKGRVIIPVRKWKNLLSAHRGEPLDVSIFEKKETGWVRYAPLRFTIAPEPVDPWLVYRLIEPGYVSWNKMGIYQRCMETFEERPVFVNYLTGEKSCMNCHSFCRNNPDRMLFHIRQYNAGTIFVKDGTISKINTQTPQMISAGVYPRWHPGGRYVAFSVNTTRQDFHTTHTNKVEVYDLASDLVVYDTHTNTVFTDSIVCSKDYFETFPEWSPDGQYLYYCSAAARPMPGEYDSLLYDLLRIPFDVATGKFGKQADTLVSSVQTGKSVALARVSPDGKQVIFCMSDYGTFPIWHRENDLYLLNTETREVANLSAINSDQSDSYHSWSSNGRWIIFSSRRLDGAFTRPYLSYFDAEGKAHTPFLLPQKDPKHYDLSTKSYNLPEFITGKVKVSPYEIAKVAKGKAETVK